MQIEEPDPREGGTHRAEMGKEDRWPTSGWQTHRGAPRRDPAPALGLAPPPWPSLSLSRPVD